MGATQTKERLEAMAAGLPGGGKRSSVRPPDSHQGSHQGSRQGSLRGSLRSRFYKTEEKPPAACDPEVPPGAPILSEQDKQYLRDTWRTLESDPTTVGIITFTQLFEANPSMKNVFETFREIEMEDVKTSQELKLHAARVMGFVNKVISRLDSEDKYSLLMKDLGCKHLTYGAKPHYIDLMGEQFVSVIRPSLVEVNQWSDGTEQAWLKLFQVISYSMKQGLEEEQSAAQCPVSSRRASRLPSLRRKPAVPTPSQSEVVGHTIEY